MKLNTLIVDDEEYSRKSLYFLLQENCPDVNIEGIAKSVAEARQMIQEKNFHLVFLDIAMPKESGFDLLPSLQNKNIMVIFTTAYDQYALKALKASAVDYLLKPIDIVELKEAVQKAIERNKLTNQKEAESFQVKPTDTSESLSEKKITKITIPGISGFNVLETADIVFVEADSNYSIFHLKEGEKLITAKPLKDIEEALNGNEFVRIHKSVLVNFKYVKSYSNKNGWQIFLADGSILPVSRRRATEFQEKARQYFNK